MQLGSTVGYWLLANWSTLALAIGALAGTLGVWLALAPASLLRVDRRLGTWVPTDGFADSLNRRRHSGRFFYRHHRITGAALMVSGALLAYTLLVHFRVEAWGAALSSAFGLPALLTELAAQGLRILLVLGSALALLLGPVLYFRPSLLRPIEAFTDHWVNTDQGIAALNRPIDAPARWIERHPRATAAVLILLGLFIALSGMSARVN